MNLFDVLHNDERVIVLSNPDENIIFTWNKSLTLQCWRMIANSWEEETIRTLSDVPESFDAARKAAEQWFYDCWVKTYFTSERNEN